ncbi:dual oxidase 2, partial [Biomphalaria pfeifferi]
EQCKISATPGRGQSGQDITVKAIRLCNTFWDSHDLVKDHLEAILRGMIYTLGRAEDGTYSSDMTDYFYGPYEYSRSDRVALQLQQFRDHGLPGLNTIRAAYGLSPRDDWTTFGGPNGTLHKLYGGSTPDNVDILAGILLDDGDRLSGMTDLARTILLEQFSRIRDTDRFWYENRRLFDVKEIEEIDKITFSAILRSVTNISQIPDNIFLCQNSSSCLCKDPPNVFNASGSQTDVCSPLATYDYIQGSEASFAVSFLALALVTPVSMAVLACLVKRKKAVKVEHNKRQSTLHIKNDATKFAGKEYLGAKSGYRSVRGEFKAADRRIFIRDAQRKDLRYVDFVKTDLSKVTLLISNDKDFSHVCLKVPGDIDLILKFADEYIRQTFVSSVQKFFTSLGLTLEAEYVNEATLFSTASDKDQRQKLLDIFFRAVCFTVFEGTLDSKKNQMSVDQINEVINIKLTMTEFADAMGMQPSSVFVQNVFLLADRDKNNCLSFEEFFHLFGIFIKGTAEQKGRLLFNIYDPRNVGYLTKDEFYKMIKSLLDLAESSDLTEEAIKDLVHSMYSHVGLTANQNISYEDFRKIFCAKEYSATLHDATIISQAAKHVPFKPGTRGDNRRNTFISNYNSKNETPSNASKTFLNHRDSALLREYVMTKREYPGSPFAKRYYKVSRYFNRYRWQIFWCTLYTLITIGIFVERAFYFARGREHAGLRRMSGALVTAMIRSSASVLMFTYSSLLVTMCRNTITALRETFLHRFIPFDSAVSFHKYIAVLAMIGTIVHVVTHGINLYCMCTQTTTSINCFFGEYYTDSHSFATFHFWAYQTITGLAGVLVTVLIFLMYVFATQFSRKHVFKSFWLTHSLYWLVYILTFLHGVGRLVQAPLFAWYLIGPLILFVLDRLQSISRNRVEIAVKEATALPSGVLRLVFKRPSTFNYKSGQWVRIACTDLNKDEYHPFTLTSAPHEPFLSLHIRAVGPWTTNLRQVYSSHVNEGSPLPNIFLDGPFGEGHQDWYSCEVAVLVGGGIGVTPFASILKDIAFKSKSGIQVTCKKVFFIWVTRTQKSFEWLVDLLRSVEAADVKGIVDTHIFVTQFQQRYDLRTTMLYICERYFQKVEGQSLFTGLKSVTHFGRPNFEDFFAAIASEYKEVSQVGVFSCGPGPMTSNVQSACNYMNGLIGPTFSHHFENF